VSAARACCSSIAGHSYAPVSLRLTVLAPSTPDPQTPFSPASLLANPNFSCPSTSLRVAGKCNIRTHPVQTTPGESSCVCRLLCLLLLPWPWHATRRLPAVTATSSRDHVLASTAHPCICFYFSPATYGTASLGFLLLSSSSRRSRHLESIATGPRVLSN
jgi:hypothetical protein